MYILGPFVFPFVWLFKLLAELFRLISSGCFWLYEKLLGASIWLNDLTELNVWPKD